MNTKYNTVFVNMGLVLASLFVCLAVVELLCRIYLPAPWPEKWPLCKVEPDSILGWRMLPNDFHYTYTFPVHTNSYGLRYKEISQKNENEFRILVLGDSHVYGQGISNERLFTSLLEERFNASKLETNVSVINAGVRAYSVNQEVAFLEHVGVTLEPDLVVLCFYLNDFEIVDIKRTYEMGRRLNGGKYYVFDLNDIDSRENWRRWRLIQFLRHFRSGMYLYDGINSWRTRDDYQAKLINGICDEEIRTRIAKVREHIRKFKQIISTHQMQGLIVVIPVAKQISRDFPKEIYQSTIQSLATRYELEYLDLLPAFKEKFYQLNKLPIIPFDGHYDDKAHEVIAGELFEYIVNIVTNRRYNEHPRDFSILSR